MSMTVLIVEDEPDIRNLYEKVLRKEGFVVLLAKDGREGLDIALEKSPAVILLDILMPEMDGIAVLRSLRAKGYDGKVIILTASPILHVQEGVELGIYAYLNKVLSTPKEIADLIKQAVK